MSEPLSNTQLKNRLLGAGVLVLLAVILIPLLLGDPKYVAEQAPVVPESTEFQSRIQPLPGTVQESSGAAESKLNQDSAGGGLVLKKLDNDQATVAAQPDQVAIQPLRLDKLTSEAPKKAVTAPPKITQKPKPKPSVVTKTAESVKTGTGTPKATTSKIKSGWAVQAGIFSKSDNAKAIAGILKSNGYTPNISDAKASFGKAKRVWIGPFTSKSEAQAISKQLEQQTGNGGYVAVYPFKS